MERVVLRHLSGSKANQVEEFPLDGFRDVVVGRDPSATVRYDPDRDDLVGRQHARLVQDPGDRYRFTIIDLNSRNGTYVNRQRIVGSATVAPGDVIQFGPGGPELQFAIDPPPPHLPPPTRLAEQAAPPATRLAEAAPPAVVVPPAVPVPAAVGKATVERMVTQAKTESRMTVAIVGALVVALILVVAGLLVYRFAAERARLATQIGQTQKELTEVQKAAPMSAADIAKAYTDSTVFIEVGWKLILTESGSQLYHEYHIDTDREGKPVKNEQGEIVPVPVYIQMPDGRIEPSLSEERGAFEQNQPIGGQHMGSGFVVTGDGFILTNRHVAATWETSYTNFPNRPGYLVNLQTKKVSQINGPPMDWVPANAQVVGRTIVGKNVDGRLDYLDVTFAKNKLRLPAKLARVSDRHDAAMIKVDVPQPVKKVELYDNYDQIQPGANITILGYPAVSPVVAVTTRSQDPFNREAQQRVVPDPTVTGGLVGRVLRGQVTPSGGRETDYVSAFGDSYQLTANATGGGNSGGPVFDDRGRVIAIYYASTRGETRISFAVPIRYGLELMQVGSVIK